MKRYIANDLTASWHRNGESKLLYIENESHCFISSGSLTVYCRCVNYGVLPEDEAERVNRMILLRKGKKGTVSSPVPASKKASSKKAKLEKDVAVKADLQISGAERVGSSTML
jgi:hypothetical protein